MLRTVSEMILVTMHSYDCALTNKLCVRTILYSLRYSTEAGRGTARGTVLYYFYMATRSSSALSARLQATSGQTRIATSFGTATQRLDKIHKYEISEHII